MKSLKKFIKEQHYDWDTLEKKIGNIAEKIGKLLKKEGYHFIADGNDVCLYKGDDPDDYVCISDRFHSGYPFDADQTDWSDDPKAYENNKKVCVELNKYLKQLAKIEDEDGETFFIGIDPNTIEPSIMNDNDFAISLVD